MEEKFLTIGPDDAEFSILLAHGAGAPMDSASMNALAETLADAGFRVGRFEFGYMAERRRSGRRLPAPRAETLIPEYLAAVTQFATSGPVIIGGKSMGGRVASMVADQLYVAGSIAGLLCLGYPFHPIGKPAQLRTTHLQALKTPTLICQGTRDPFGSLEEVQDYALSAQISLFWLDDGDHDFRPRKAVSGFTLAAHLQSLSSRVSAWIANLRPAA
ncbi:alpha/beta hydrolase [Rhizobium grahamii]|uniref:Alpha/beta hydrolase n=1 Tax=Rhizobium grahamii TaxID=1120045 RepID=A0A5Q0CAP0_9HYPH|nr:MULTISPECIES: alpha/beta family hydrolase [Rhizobium]QFY61474.1 alpha/beta hydrolase [Rhizobium grahamii]QRM49373.1 alpha/beta hydrolase [Rhizobium sp. BG6]